MKHVILICGIFLTILGCSDERVLLREDHIVAAHRECRLLERVTTSKHGINSGFTLHVVVACDAPIEKNGNVEIELFKTRYPYLYNINIIENNNEEDNMNIYIEYCQYRNYISFDQFKNNIERAKKQFGEILSFDIVPSENKRPCLRYP